MRCLSKKILCYILIGLLTFSVTSTVYYKSVHAMEWVGGALAFEEALKWLLAAIGITATAGMTDAYWDTYGDDFTDYAIENGATQTEVAEWQLKACQGIIDKGSEVWSKFKAWASELVNGSSSGDISNIGFYEGMTFGELRNILNNTYNTNFPNTHSTEKVYGFVFNSDSTPYIWCVCESSGIDHFSFANSGANNFAYLHVTQSFRCLSGNTSLSVNYRSTGYTSAGTLPYYATTNIANETNFDINYISIDNSGSAADSNFEASASNVNDLDVISSDGVDEDNPEVTVPMPGVSDSDNEASKDAYQDIIDAINDGTITQEQGVEQIQEILKIVTYDTVTDKVVPPQVDPDTGEDKTKDDVLKENKENMGFTLGGLEAVFPFCIPFDIYAFMTLLVADPVCPEFDFPIKSVNGQVEEIHIDLEPFEPVAVVVRYCFDFLFIIGLAMLTRSLIGGGGSD